MGGEATGPEQLRAAVRDRVERGADLVKVMASGGVMTPGSDALRCQFQLAELRVVVEEAHAAGLPVTAHAHGLPAVEQAVDAEVDGIEHCTCLTSSGIQMPTGCWNGWPAAELWYVRRWAWQPDPRRQRRSLPSCSAPA